MILRPSLIFGLDGDSSQLFLNLAKLPVAILPAGGKQIVRPVHILDLVSAICNWLHKESAPSALINAVGDQEIMIKDLLISYKKQQSDSKYWFDIKIPASLINIIAQIAGIFPSSPLSPDNWTMLQQNNTADPAPFKLLLSRAPCDIDNYIQFFKEQA